MTECANDTIDWGFRPPIDTTYKTSTLTVLQSGVNLPQPLDNVPFMRLNVPANTKYFIDPQQV